MGTGVLVRPATADDLPLVRALLVETWHDTYDDVLGKARVAEITNAWHSVEALKRQLDLTHASFLVAENAGTIVGHILTNATPPLLIISRLYVLPRRQREGIGAALLSAASARHEDCDTIRLEVAAENPKGIAFYRREGFRPVGEKTDDGLHHIVMEKRLTRGG